MPSIPCNFSPSFTKINRLCAYPMQSRFYCPSFADCRFSLRGCRKGPPPLPLSSAGGGVYPAEERFSVCQDATTCWPLPFHPFRKLLPKENRFRYAKPGARHSRVPGFVSLVQRGFILSARLLTGENLPPTRSAAASPSTGSWSPRRFPTHNAHRGRSAPRTSCTSRPTAQPSPRQW